MDAVRSLLGTRPCRCGQCAAVSTENVVIGESTARAILDTAGSRTPLIFGDQATLTAAAATISALGERGWRTVDLTPRTGALHANDRAVASVRTILDGLEDDMLPVAIGAGTVNDVVKAAAHDLRREYLCVATAASMNGYTSAIAAITVDGLKSTLASTPPRTVVADPAVLAAAPAAMTRSGLADLLSKPVSAADWKLSHLLWDDPYCPTPGRLAGDAVERAAGAVSGLRRAEPDAVLVLFEALLLSGISMAVAGSSSPASGGEHLISHFLDMTAAYATGGPTTGALHGLQVGVATRVTTRLYEALLARAEDQIDWEQAAAESPTLADAETRLQRETRLPDALRARFLDESRKKLARIGEPRTRVARIRERWDEIRRRLSASVNEARRFAVVLDRVGAPVTARDIGTTPAELERAFRLGRWVRDRYTVLDLADDLGLLDRLAPTVLP